eukprot:scaffold34676_cov176-Amphora_coffeaeformis.AAC.8
MKAFLSFLVASSGLIGAAGIATSSKIHVWDNVMDNPARAVVHQVAADKGLGHTLMIRKNQPRTALESALKNILQELNDTSPYVEYWCRQEWRHIEAHADVDEYRAKTNPGDDFEYPTHGHVLYLQIGPKVRGPTCLFPDCTSGGDLVRGDLSVLTVPAVSGRLLRFPGHWLHAVPRPTDLWMLPFVKGSPDFSEDFLRSVVLFNTWNEAPPMQVLPLEDDDESSCSSGQQSQDKDLVNAFTAWETLQIVDSQSSSILLEKTKIWLLGDQKRRNYQMRTVPVYSNGDILREALHAESEPRSTPLSQAATEA